MIISKIKVSNLLTYLGIVASVAAIFLAINNCISWSYICFICSGICDMLDGKFASMFTRSDIDKEIGIELDSLADVISFLLVPVVIGYSMGMNNMVNIIIYIVYVICGITRLAFFNVYAREKKEKNENITYYTGLAVTYSSLIFPLVYLLSYFIVKKNYSIIYSMVMVIVGCLFISDFKVKKPGKVLYIFYGVLALITCTVIILMEGMI